MNYLSITVGVLLICLDCMAGQTADDNKADATTSGTGETADLLRFSNGDTLHGLFMGFGEDSTVLWKSPEALSPIRFSTKKIHRAVLNRGFPNRDTRLKSTISLINGDVIPGTITAADPQTVHLLTEHLGSITIPMHFVEKITTTPHGGKIYYHGPMSSEGWHTISRAKPAKDAINAEQEDKEALKDAAAKPDDKPAGTDWKHVANAWYSGTDKFRYLVRKDALPDTCRLAFKLAWRGPRLYANIAIHADLAPPDQDAPQDLRHNMAATTGNAYVFTISSHNVSLYGCSFDENGKPHNNRIGSGLGLNFSSVQETVFELRINRPKKQILLYLDGQFRTKWDLEGEYAGKGNALAISNIGYSNCDLRISDIIISEWNGLKDSAQSMRSKDRDVILLNNGLDRFSGTFNHLRNETVSFTGNYNNQLNIPVNEVQEIQLAPHKTEEKAEQKDERSVYFYLPPWGRISGCPVKTGNTGTMILSDLLGELNLDTNYVNIIDFSHQNILLDAWDENF